MNAEWMASVHEAGHAVACVVLGGVVREVRVGAENKDRGACVTAFFSDAEVDAEGRCLNLPVEEVLKRHQKEIIMALAGFAAEKQEFPTVNRGRQAGGAEGDIEQVRFNAEQLARCGVQFNATPAGGPAVGGVLPAVAASGGVTGEGPP